MNGALGRVWLRDTEHCETLGARVTSECYLQIQMMWEDYALRLTFLSQLSVIQGLCGGGW